MLNWKIGSILDDLFYATGLIGRTIVTGWGNCIARFHHAAIDMIPFSPYPPKYKLSKEKIKKDLFQLESVCTVTLIDRKQNGASI
jgi:hypothetical protein